MVVLHICPLSDDLCNGVHIVVPLHVKAQQKYADAALWNLGQPIDDDGIDRYFTADDLSQLPVPYREPDLVVFHELYIPRYLSIAKQLKKQGIPYIILPHGALKRTAQKKSRMKKIAANLLLFRRFCNNAAGIQCLTENEKTESVMGKNIFVAPNGINFPAQTKTEFRTDSTRFVYIGRILPFIKGLDLMIEAFAKEKAFFAEHNATLDIYGPAEDRGVSYIPEMRELIKKYGLENLVKLNPAVIGEEKHKTLLDADVFVQTSRTEGMPMGILEALAYGLPCVVTKGTTFAEQIASAGAGWNAGDSADSIAAALKNAVGNRAKLSEYSANALNFSNKFNWDNAAETALSAYRDCLEKK